MPKAKTEKSDDKLLMDMLKAGVHFGHQKSRWQPKMAPYVYTIRHNVHIIDLEKTAKKLKKAQKFLSKINKQGKKILFIATKKQAKKIIQKTAESVNMPYVNERWLGGTFTNFKEIVKLLKKLDTLEKKLEEKLSKRDKHKIEIEIKRLLFKVGGLRGMEKLPGAVFILDIKENHLALKEALEVKIPVVALVDTNTDPSKIDYPIPANDDGIKSIKLILKKIKECLRN